MTLYSLKFCIDEFQRGCKEKDTELGMQYFAKSFGLFVEQCILLFIEMGKKGYNLILK